MKNLWLIDFKTAKAVYDEYYLQVAAYRTAVNDGLTDGAERIDHAGILLLDKETGKPAFTDCSAKLEENWLAFWALRDYYRLKIEPYQEIKKGYKLNGKMVPSVTTILDLLQKPALIQWAANSTVDYFQDNLKELQNPELTVDRLEYILKKAKTAYKTISKKALDVGSLVHDAIHCFLSGGSQDDALKIIGDNPQAFEGFHAFLKWKDEVNLEPMYLERQVIHTQLEYGGTVDLIGYADIETS